MGGKADSKLDQDLRFAPADESMSDEELEARSRKLARAAISGGTPRRGRSPPKPREKCQPEAAQSPVCPIRLCDRPLGNAGYNSQS